MKFDLKKYLGEATEYDKKEGLEENNPISWLKSIVAFAVRRHIVGGVNSTLL